MLLFFCTFYAVTFSNAHNSYKELIVGIHSYFFKMDTMVEVFAVVVAVLLILVLFYNYFVVGSIKINTLPKDKDLQSCALNYHFTNLRVQCVTLLPPPIPSCLCLPIPSLFTQAEAIVQLEEPPTTFLPQTIPIGSLLFIYLIPVLI